MGRTRVLLVVLCLAVAWVAGGSPFAVQPTGRLVGKCPQEPLPLPSNATMQVTDVVLKAVSGWYPGIDTRRAMVGGADLARENIVHGVLAKQQCGDLVWHRTMVVYVSFPQAAKLSLAQGVLFISWLKQGWRVWGVLQLPVTEVENALPGLPTGPAVDLGGCPENPLPLPPDAIAHATNAALKAVPTLYTTLQARGAIVERAALAPADQRGRQVKLNCGKEVWRRTVIVNLHFPIIEKEMQSASGSQGTVFVSRLKGGWKVWEVAH